MASPPRNGVYIVQGEASLVVSALRKNARWGTHNLQDEDQDPLLHSFSQLKDILSTVTDIGEVDVNVFLLPFLNVIRSEDTTGPITGVALSSVNKFLSYGLIDPSKESAASGIENLADAVTHARFVGTDPSSDEVVLMKILQVLRTLLLTPVGAHMTNESVCEIMQSCFRICFEMRLSELLRRSAEQTLMDMVQLLFSRLPQFKEETKAGIIPNFRKVFKRAGAIASGKRMKKYPSPKTQRAAIQPPPLLEAQEQETDVAPSSNAQNAPETSPQKNWETQSPASSQEVSETGSDVVSMDSGLEVEEALPAAAQDFTGSTDSLDTVSEEESSGETCSQVTSSTVSTSTAETADEAALAKTQQVDSVASHVMESPESEVSPVIDRSASVDTEDGEEALEQAQQSGDFVNPRGVRFTPQEPHKEGNGPLIPYGLPCVRELFRFLISLISPSDRHNSDTMIHMGLSLLTVAFESGASHINKFSSLMNLVKDEMCRNLFMLLHCDVHSLFAMALRVSFLVLESLRCHLKFQMELFFKKIMEILAMDVQSVPYWKRELILDCINQLFRVPHLVTELYINYDCDLYSKDLFDELSKLLSKNAFPAGGLCTVNLLALDALLGVVNTIESHCHPAKNEDQTKPEQEVGLEISTEKKKEKSGDDSGTDEHCELPPLSPPPPPTSGYAMASQMSVGVVSDDNTPSEHEHDQGEESEVNIDDSKLLWSSLCHMYTTTLPSTKDLAKLKHKKKLLRAGTEQFNTKAKKGIEFLQEHGLLSTPLDPEEVAIFFRENHDLDKKTIGDYIGEKRNTSVLESFVRSFHFKDVRLDEAMRQFLETFRLPGESPVIEHIMEHFTAVYYELIPEPFANKDATFTLAYAVILLNVDQHNTNIKQQKPMTLEQFKRNLRKTNGNSDFPPEYLEKVYNAIRTEEIVMPSERTGKVKENYEWDVLLKRSLTPESRFISCHGSSYDRDLFLIIWGPTVAALSYVYDNGVEKSVVQKALGGFRKSALISAHYGLSDVFDNLVISLCKFSTLLTTQEPGENLPIMFGGNLKAQYSARTMFALAHRHGDILREGWKNILDCMLQLYKSKLLPKTMVEVEDFVEGKMSLIREEIPLARPDSSIFSSFYQYIMLNPEPASGRGQTAEDRQAQEQAQTCVKDCHPDLLITESKFLRTESLNELVKALVYNSSGPDTHESLGTQYDEEAAVFFLEVLIKVVLQNRDRVSLLWHTVRDHITNLIITANQHSLLIERAVVGLLRLAGRLLRKEEMSSQVLLSLRILLMMKFAVLQKCCRQISFGLHEILRTNASSVKSLHDWDTIFTLIECVGAAVSPPTITPGPSLNSISKECDGQVDPDYDMMEGYCADSETASIASVETENSTNNGPMGETWLVISKDDGSGMPVNQYDLKLNEKINKHDSKSFVKSCQTMAFLIHDGAHVSTENFLQCIHAVRIFAEASVNGGAGCRLNEHSNSNKVIVDRKGSWGKSSKKKYDKNNKRPQSPTMSKSKKFGRPSSPTSSDSDEAEIYETINDKYDAMSLQLIELMHMLHTQASSLYGINKQDSEDNEDQMSFLWVKCWCPLLQGIARLCCDIRREVRMSALTYLQRALLVQDLQSLSAVEWESCFNKVLFPMLSRLLEVSSTQDPIALEETRMRAATLLCKVFLQHLSPLLSLSTFTALWLTILDFMDKYMHADDSDLLLEAIPESLKNMLLVMSTAGIFHEEGVSVENTPQQNMPHPDTETHKYSALWQVTWERIDCFLPKLKHELFLSRSHPSSSRPSSPASPSPEPVVTEMVRSAEQTPAKSEDTTASSTASSNITQPPPGNQVCVILQPPLPSLSGSRSSSPNLQTSLTDNNTLNRPNSVPIILAPSPSSKPGTPNTTHTNTPTDTEVKEITESAGEETENNKQSEAAENTDKPVTSESATKPAFSIYDI